MLNKIILKTLGLGISTVILLTLTQCAGKTSLELPRDILGISIGMNKENAEKRLREIGKYEREERKRQQVWSLKDDPRFAYVALGYDQNNQVRYITAIAKPKGGQPMQYDEVGDISAAKQEAAEKNYRYVWEVPAKETSPAYAITAQGTDPKFLSLYTLSKSFDPAQTEQDEK